MQQKWLVDVENKEAVERLFNLGVLLFVPRLPTNPIHVTILTDQTKEEILQMEGVLAARKPLDVQLNEGTL